MEYGIIIEYKYTILNNKDTFKWVSTKRQILYVLTHLGAKSVGHTEIEQRSPEATKGRGNSERVKEGYQSRLWEKSLLPNIETESKKYKLINQELNCQNLSYSKYNN
jgi:hypothetical protein